MANTWLFFENYEAKLGIVNRVYTMFDKRLQYRTLDEQQNEIVKYIRANFKEEFIRLYEIYEKLVKYSKYIDYICLNVCRGFDAYKNVSDSDITYTPYIQVKFTDSKGFNLIKLKEPELIKLCKEYDIEEA